MLSSLFISKLKYYLKEFSFLSLCGFSFLFVIFVTFNSISYAQLIPENPGCASAASSATSAPSFEDIVNPQRNLPFLPDVCTVDANKGANALEIKYLGLAFIRIYKFMISFAFYGFGLSLAINGVLYQFNLIQGNADAFGAFKKNITKSVIGVITVLLAYFIIQMILWIFNLQSLTSQTIT
jgi:hypothetical protein